MDNQYGFIVDTNKYSGNFEREMCAFMTGHIGECGVGDEFQTLYLRDHKPVAGVIQLADEHECYRPVEIWATPGVWNNGMGFNYKVGEEGIALGKYRESVRKYNENLIKTAEGHRGKNIPTWTDEAIDRAIEGYKDTIEDAENLQEPHKYPAYQSIRIHFDKPLTAETIAFLKERAKEFAENYSDGLKIVSFRVVETVTLESFSEV